MDDVHLDLATLGERFFESFILSNGQTCYLSMRILVPSSRYDEIIEVLETFVRSLKIEDALDPATQIGPMATRAHRDRVEAYIATGVAEGARLLVGGGRPVDLPDGWFVEPTLFVGVDNASTIAREEIFGPVLSVIRHEDEDDAVRLANESDYGLGGTVWSADPERAMAIARRMDTGTVGINRYLPDPSSPFGGVKASGLGRERGPGALDAYVQTKAIFG
ncbi:aldehyde dehydrogenase family protein [Nocardioides sp. LHG3406-4]|uniref:aldehyde dehydrogenase family protein n=1 Tax=Nocardioides sp. LHG3406-4 TaxID=2804575 RepID=UPI003CE8ECF7